MNSVRKTLQNLHTRTAYALKFGPFRLSVRRVSLKYLEEFENFFFLSVYFHKQ
jgi:hypothetical protein